MTSSVTILATKQNPGAQAHASLVQLERYSLSAFELYRSCTEPYVRRETAVQQPKPPANPRRPFWSIRA